MEDSVSRVTSALNHLASQFCIKKCSDVYTTPECHGLGSVYANAVVEVVTPLAVAEVAAMLKDYERQCGRDDEARRRSEVPIDADIVICNNEVLRFKDFSQSYFRTGYDRLKEIQ